MFICFLYGMNIKRFDNVSSGTRKPGHENSEDDEFSLSTLAGSK